MEGRGITNYSTEKPTFAYSTQTTEFDDALVDRGIVTLEQVYMAKGASAEEAQRLSALKRNEGVVDEIEDTTQVHKKEIESDEDESEDDDEFLKRYRRQRLEELKKLKGPYGEVISIARPEWTREVNEDSEKAWVVVTLTSHNVERTGCVEVAIHKLAPKFPSVKFVSIPSTTAIADWPDENLPTVFLYRDGKLQRQFIRMRPTITSDELEWDLAECGVLDTVLDEPPAVDKKQAHSSAMSYGSSSIFGGSLAQLETRQYENDDEVSD